MESYGIKFTKIGPELEAYVKKVVSILLPTSAAKRNIHMNLQVNAIIEIRNW